MIFLRRALLIVLASLAVTFAALQLGRTPWADDIRARQQRFIQEHPRPPPEVRKTTAADNRPRQRSFSRQYLQPWSRLVFLAGVPGGLTLLVLAAVNRRRKRRGQGMAG